MKKLLAVVVTVVCSAVVFTSCKKETDTLDTELLQDFFPLTVGKTWVYRIDSTYPVNFGTALVEKGYHAKDTVINTFSDNLGRITYVIHRYITDTAEIANWNFATTIHATNTGTSIEYVENNLRFVKLSAPIRHGFSWYGHAFIDTKNSNYSYLDKVNGWDYTYTNVGEPVTVINKTYDNTITVFQNDETTPPGPFDPNVFKQHMSGKEVFAKDVGLIFKEILFWTWQASPTPGGQGHYQDDSYGLRLRLIRHN